MTHCWAKEPRKRPQFSAIVEKMEIFVEGEHSHTVYNNAAYSVDLDEDKTPLRGDRHLAYVSSPHKQIENNTEPQPLESNTIL